jgi:uncharacterized protein YjdB
MKLSKVTKSVLLSVSLLYYAAILYSQQLAFPTAEGYGKYVTGGRGGTVYEVTTLNPTGAGSLGAAISASGPRTVVFKVAGTITGNFNITNGNITIAGQTAPGDGICIKGNLSTSADNIIIRYIRVRYNPTVPGDAIGGRYHNNIIIDHVSASWSADEVFTLYWNQNTTVQWCIISEGCEKFENGVSVGHRFGGIWGNNPGTWHHNLFAHNDSRNPRWASGCGYNDYRNNVLYNWGYQGCYGGEKDQGDGVHNFTTINVVANYYKSGPASLSKSLIANPSARSVTDKGDWYVADNYVNGYPSVTANNWLGVTGSNYIKMSAPWDAMPINQQTAEQAYLSVLDYAGCSFPNRDSVDARIIEEARTGTAKYGNKGIIDVPGDVGGWPVLATGTAYTDSDHDGMSDEWEDNNGLNKNDPSDRNGIGEGGYTNLEVFLYKLVGEGGPVTGLSLIPAADTLGIYSTLQLNARIEPYGASNQNLSWSSSDTTIAKVSSTGLVTGVALGTDTITATTEDGGFTAQSIITVVSIPVTGVKMSQNTLSVNVGATAQLTSSVEPETATNKTVIWSSSDTTITKVSSTGLVTGISKGTATITVSSAEGGFSANCTVTVLEAVIYQAENYTSQSGNSVLTSFGGYTGSGYVDFGSEGAWLEWNNIKGDSSGTVDLIFRYANGSIVNRQCAISVNGITVGNMSFAPTGTWSDWNTQAVTVNLISGNNTVRLTVNTISGGPNLDYVNVSSITKVPVTGVSVLPTSVSVNVGATVQLTDTVLPLDATFKNVSWSSSDTSKATVSPTGLVTGVAEGSAVITVTTEDGGFTATSDITVLEPTSVATIETDQDIDIFPIPFNNRLNIQFGREFAETVDIFLLDATGRIVRYKRAIGLSHQLDVMDLNEGLYLVKIVGPEINLVKTVLKIR